MQTFLTFLWSSCELWRRIGRSFGWSSTMTPTSLQTCETVNIELVVLTHTYTYISLLKFIQIINDYKLKKNNKKTKAENKAPT